MTTRPDRGHVLKRAVILAATAPLLRADAAGTTFAVRAASAQRRGISMFPDVPNPAPSVALVASVALDELMVLSMGILGSMGSQADYDRSSSELDDAARYYESHGWADDAVGYFEAPVAPDAVAVTPTRQRRGPLEELRFASEWEPRAGEPGRDRWLSFAANRDVHTVMLRHDDGPRPWLVCVHGQGMGRRSDVEFFRLRRLHRDLGVNVMVPVLPLHGPRPRGHPARAAVRVERLSREQRARARTVDLGPAADPGVAPRRRRARDEHRPVRVLARVLRLEPLVHPRRRPDMHRVGRPVRRLSRCPPHERAESAVEAARRTARSHDERSSSCTASCHRSHVRASS